MSFLCCHIVITLQYMRHMFVFLTFYLPTRLHLFNRSTQSDPCQEAILSLFFLECELTVGNKTRTCFVPHWKCTVQLLDVIEDSTKKGLNAKEKNSKTNDSMLCGQSYKQKTLSQNKVVFCLYADQIVNTGIKR